MGRVLVDAVISHTTCFGIAVPAENKRINIANGSVFFVQTPKALLAVTAKHVYEDYIAKKAESDGVECQIANLPFLPDERLVGLGKAYDIATFRMLPEELRKINKIPMTCWPPLPPQEGGGILYAGFPGTEKTENGPRDFSFGVYAGSGVARTVTDMQIKSLVEHEHLIDVYKLGRLPEPGFDTGGMSGGPVMTLVESDHFLHWRLGGVIVQGWAAVDMILAHRADVIMDDGRIRG
jgi:hypothetical protein